MALIISLLAEVTKDLSEKFIDSVREALTRIVLPEKIDWGVAEGYVWQTSLHRETIRRVRGETLRFFMLNADKESRPIRLAYER